MIHIEKRIPMKTILNKLAAYFHLEHKQWISMFLLTLIMNFLYCSLYSIVSILCNSITQPILYYVIQYALYIALSIIYYLLFTQFIRQRLQDKAKLQWNSFIFPLCKLETIFFVLMQVVGYFAFTTSIAISPLRYLFMILSILLVIIYIPIRLYGYHQIYHQQKNPFIIFKDSIKTLSQHYLSCFYSWIIMAILFGISYYIGIYIFAIPLPFYFITMASNILTLINPFMPLYIFMQGTQTMSLLAFIFTMLVGLGLSLAMVYYFSFMISVFDDEIKS